MKRLLYWITDYAYMTNGWRMMYRHRNPPKHYLGHIVPGKDPVILIPGITLKWGFMKRLGDAISLAGHPTYVVTELGHNMRSIPDSSKIVEKIISDNNLKSVTIVAHSKGGLIAKHLLNHSKYSPKITKIIAIATPFSGSSLAKYLPKKYFSELRPESEIINSLSVKCDLDSRICTIQPSFDNHVWHSQQKPYPVSSSNLVFETKGHHKILFDSTVINTVLELI